ncbi:MAG TPA: PfkB family carbohydrate kinase, partial [Planctomycetota bacterium]|nr:PfkB family carbohydrate kinase [Planctomycetota bacterium]
MTPDLARKFAAIGQPRVLVVGDLMLDRYVWGSVDRISPEAPIQVLKVEREEERCGGAGSVAVNLAVLGARVAFATALGADAAADRLRERMERRGVSLEAVVPLADRPTTVKTRFLARGQQVLRVDHEDASPLPGPAARRLLAAIAPALRQADIVLLPDYNKGVLTLELLAPLIARCRRAGKRVLVDPARGVDPGRYRGCSAISPNFVEAAEAAGLNVGRSEVDRIGRRLLRRLELEACVVTMDRDGIALYRGGQRPRKFPARARELYDITGAGDMVLSVLGLVLGAGGSWDEAVEAANLAGGLEVAKIGVVPLSRE